MMATSMGPNFTGHPAGMGHPGVAGHPMGPGMPHNGGQPGVPGGIPHQFGGPMAVSGPGGQVNPALMGNMPPGANQNAHAAMQHMSPVQQQMFRQQQMQQYGINDPGLMRQQQLLAQQRQALMAQQAFQANAMQGGMNMPAGMQQLNQLNPQQLHQLRAAGRLGPAQHPQTQAIMVQQLALQQQQQQQHVQQQQQQAQAQAQAQAAHNQQMQANHTPGQPMPMNPQGMPNMQQNQLAASLQNQMAGQQAQQPQGQPQPQPQPQPQQPGQQAQHTPQQTSQAGTPAPTGPQTPAQTPSSTPAQPNQLPPGQTQPQPPQSQPQPPPQIHPAQHMSLTNQLLEHQAVQTHHQQNIRASMREKEGMKGQCLLKLMQFGEHLSGFPGSKGKDDLTYWNNFVIRFFSPNAVFRHSLHITDVDDNTPKQYEIAFPAIARYFHTHFNNGVKNMQLLMDKGTTDRPLPGDCHCIENTKASLVYWFETGSHLVASGTLRAQFDGEQKIELFEFLTSSHEEYISRKQVIDAAKPAHMWMKEWNKVNSQDGKQSPEMSKKGKARQMKSPQSQPPEVLVDLPDSAVNSKGVTEAVFQFLEIVEVMGQMNPLFGFTHNNPGLGPYAALEQYVSTHINGAVANMNGQAMPPGGPRTPSFGQFPMGASPAAAHMNLPGSPHVGSPAPGNMQAPGMQLQQSQQGTSPSGPSANTSPASHKRRRPSTVKAEEDGSGAPTPGSGQLNGMPRATKPATPRMPKRVKGNPA